jgi:hypothetical protein
MIACDLHWNSLLGLSLGSFRRRPISGSAPNRDRMEYRYEFRVPNGSIFTSNDYEIVSRKRAHRISTSIDRSQTPIDSQRGQQSVEFQYRRAHTKQRVEMIRGDPNDFSVSSPIPTQSASILGGPGGDDGRLLRRREGFPGEMAQATPDVGARQGSRGQKRRVAQRRIWACSRLRRRIGGSSHLPDDPILSTCTILPLFDVRSQFVGAGGGTVARGGTSRSRASRRSSTWA